MKLCPQSLRWVGGGAEMTVKRYLSGGEVGSPPSTNEPLVGRIPLPKRIYGRGGRKRSLSKKKKKWIKRNFNES